MWLHSEKLYFIHFSLWNIFHFIRINERITKVTIILTNNRKSWWLRNSTFLRAWCHFSVNVHTSSPVIDIMYNEMGLKAVLKSFLHSFLSLSSQSTWTTTKKQKFFKNLQSRYKQHSFNCGHYDKSHAPTSNLIIAVSSYLPKILRHNLQRAIV